MTALAIQSRPQPRGLRRPCSWPGCSTLVAHGRCEKHASDRSYDARRGTSAERGYDANWRRLGRLKLQDEPLCEIRTHCGINGLPVAVAVEVDHKIPIREYPEGRLDWSNLQSACKSCHSAKTMRESVHKVRN